VLINIILINVVGFASYVKYGKNNSTHPPSAIPLSAMLSRDTTTESVLGECCSCAQTASKPYRYTLPGSGEGDNSATGVGLEEEGMAPASSPNRGSASTSRLRIEVAGRTTLMGLLELDIISTICRVGQNETNEESQLEGLLEE
jgi:hypothetical protein